MTAIEPPKRVMLVTGEASGDLHGAEVIHALKDRAPGTVFFGVGGHQMEKAGCKILIPSADLAVVGLVEVLGHLPAIWRSFQKLKRLLQGTQKPDVLVLIDFPEFNLRLAKQAKKAGVPVLYYVSPQVWAWRRGRVKKIAAVVDRLAAIFPFEPDLYQGLDIDVRYVGHPLLDEFCITKSREEMLEDLGIENKRLVVGLFPGSRRSELKYMLDTLVDTARVLSKKYPDIHFLVPVASTLSKEQIGARFSDDIPVTLVDSRQTSIYDLAHACNLVVTVSGTVTLQIALAGTPMVILYKMTPLTYAIGKRLVRVDHIGLANIVAGKRVVPELIQDRATPENLAGEVMRILDDQSIAEGIRDQLKRLQNQLGESGCAGRVAEMVLAMVEEKSRERAS